MNRIAIIIAVAVTALFYFAPGVSAVDCKGSDGKRCAKLKDDGPFEKSSRAIDNFHPKVWPLQPMKRLGPVKKEQVSFFQKAADGIRKKRCAADE